MASSDFLEKKRKKKGIIYTNKQKIEGNYQNVKVARF